MIGAVSSTSQVRMLIRAADGFGHSISTALESNSRKLATLEDLAWEAEVATETLR